MSSSGGCSPLTVSFTNTTTGAAAGATYKWDLGNGNTSTLVNPGATYRDEKTFTVSLTVTSGGQTSTKTLQLVVYKKPVVSFTTPTVKGCAPLSVDFTSNSTAGDGTITGNFWDFGDGTTTSQSGGTVNHVYNFAQKSAVSLTVTNSYGCTNTLSKPDLVDVSAGITVAFTADKTILCKISDAVTFNNTSTGPPGITYAWDFGDGKTSTDKNPVHIYNKKGIFSIKLTVSSSAGCTQTITQTDYLNVANFSTSFDVPTLVCEKTNTVFNNTSSPGPSGTYWELDNNGYSYDYSGNYYFNAPGTYAVKLTNTFGTCQESVTKNVVVKGGPALSGFIANMGGVCGAPVTINFKDTAKAAVKWDWNFNYPYGSNTSAVKEPSFTYTSEGYYNVALTISNTDGCSTTVVQGVNVFKPNISILASSLNGNLYNGCAGLKIKFGASPSTDVADYKWDFGDGGTSTVAEPTHTFSNAGDYNVTLSYTTNSGCKGVSNYYTISVYSKPDVDFTSISGTTICGNTPVTFQGTTNNSIQPSNWYWIFGDNYYASYYGQTADHQYYADTVYTVTLIANNGSCADTVTKKDYIKVLPPFPKIVNATNTCDGTRGIVNFTQDSKKALSGTWDFGDGGTAPFNVNKTDVNHTYKKSGTYKVVLTAVNGQCSVRDSLMTYVLLKQQPLLSSVLTELCGSDDLDIKITNLDTNPYPYIYYYYPYTVSNFQYGDKTNFAGYNTSPNLYWATTYTSTLTNLQNGQKDLRAILTSGYFGCSDTSNFLPLTVKGPVADFDILQNNVCYKTPVVFDNKSKGTNNVQIKTWEWFYGDGNSASFSDGNNVSHAYSDPGSYNATLKVTDTEGCSSTTDYYAHLAVANGPKAAFNYYPSSVSPNTTVNFYNNSNSYNSYNSEYTWIFPDNSASQDYYGTYTFSQLGDDTVKLVANNPSTGCTDTAVQVIRVKNVNASFTYTTSYINNNSCPPVVIKFTNTSLNANSVSWDFGDGGHADNQNFPSHTYYNPGVYNVTIYVTGINGLTDSTTDSITVKGPYAVLNANVLQGCSKLDVTITAEVRNAVSYTWDFGDGSLEDSKDTFAIHQYTSPGIYTPALILKDAGGCSGTSGMRDKIVIDTLDVTLKDLPSVCNGSSVSFHPAVQSLAADQLQQTLQYKWRFGTGIDGDTSNLAIPYFSFTNPGKYAVDVQVLSPYGCTKEATDTIEVLRKVKPAILSPAEICQETNATFTATSDSVGTFTWSWNFGNGHVANIQNPPAELYTDSGTAQVQLVLNNNGCADTTANSLIVRPKPTINLVPRLTNVCFGKSVLLTAGGGNVFVWRNDPGLSSYSIAQPAASPAANTQYQVEVTNTFGCKNIDSALVTVSSPFKVKLPADTSICQGKDLQLIAAGATTYHWINNTTGLSSVALANPVATTLVPMVYTVVGYDAYNCFSDTQSVKVSVAPLPTISAGPDLSLLTGASVTLQTSSSPNVEKYSWSPAEYLSCSNCAAPVSTPRAPVAYVVTATTRFGCSASDTVRIGLICDQSHVYIPNAFTPNGDNKNDVFYIKGRGVKMIRSLKIFNRFGEAIFEKDNFQIEDRLSGWDGKNKGIEVATGAYVYFAEMICDSGENFSLKGTVMVIR